MATNRGHAVSLHKETLEKGMEVNSNYRDFKPGSLLQASTRYFPVNRVFQFVENETKPNFVDIYSFFPKDLLTIPQGWPKTWTLIPMDKLPLEAKEHARNPCTWW